jgi:hypothetical protein
MQTTGQMAADIANLEMLAAELITRGLDAGLRTVQGHPPYLDVRNPRVSILAERVYAQAGSFWWPWAERIASCQEITQAAAILARVLRTTGEDVGTAP